MRNINVLTYWGVANMGAWTQAYALNKLLHSIAIDDVEIRHIAYLEKSHWDMYYKTDIRLENAFLYSWNLIPHTDWMTERQLEEHEFDTLIIGSDAVWEFNPAFNNDYHMFGKNISAKKIVSYATSFGNLSVDEAKKDISFFDVKKFSSISVRDNNSAKIIQEISNKSIVPVWVLDPALVWDFCHDKAVIQPIFSNYVLVYGCTWDDEFKENAIKYAKEHKLKLVSAGYINNWCDISLRMVELRALEWIGLFAKADIVFTSTFHGLVLALNFNKQVKFNQVGYVKNRSNSLIEYLNIKDSILQFDVDTDYVEVNLKLRKMRDSSVNFLKESIMEKS